MPFIDLSKAEQARNDARFQSDRARQEAMASGLVENFASGYGEGQKEAKAVAETKRQRALKASQMANDFLVQTGQPLPASVEQEIPAMLETGVVGPGLKGLYQAMGQKKIANEDLQNKHLMAQTDKLKKDQGANKSNANKLNFDAIDALRKEASMLPASKDLMNIDTSLEKIHSAYKDPSAAGDISMVYGFMKMNDPGSTVREGEYATAQNATGVTEQVRNAYNRALSGERLGQAQRDDFLNQSMNLAGGQLENYKRAIAPIEKTISQRGLDRSQILPSINFDRYRQDQEARKQANNKKTVLPQGFDVAQIPGQQQAIPYRPDEQGIPGMSDAMAAPGNFTPRKQSRLQQLRAKKGQR